ncbi:hypothetical protein IMG5_081190 [Ichthyophthirius multifiliis]|uniref:FAD/NAD(P)-binding domain-containing protein n=1 Tax=Ichthyophthirius multifiliis TaxID=5932 RepID=G0QQL8_ICHMU|nr:hypothetical protein IMG5_081190 [Ichthyophthirius multifiliis]EGR32485.1 hypothetical protein IMG5_081190 [Ichthyophthirius multifiliis]|eukprot:XP_004036471.1 hypothetical protein IMG5_081190 [Ichthyophthirius multifiliis]
MLSQIISKNFSKKSPIHSKIAVIGGGCASLNFVSQIVKEPGIIPHQIRVFDSSKLHYYKPAWTMVGGGIYNIKDTVRKNEDLYNKWINFINLAIVKVLPDQNLLIAEDGTEYSYEHLIITSGLQNDFDKIKGAREALDDPEFPAGSIYDYNYVQKFNELCSDFGGGKAIFTEPPRSQEQSGVPQKIIYLAEGRFVKKGIRNNTVIEMRKAVDYEFPQPKYSAALETIQKQKNINIHKNSNLVEVIKDKRTAIFQNLKTQELEEVKFDLIHIVPYPKLPQFLNDSPNITDEQGYLDVDMHTLRHKKYQNIWGIGDCANLPTSKTMPAILSQTPVVVSNLHHVLSGKGHIDLPSSYDGYTSCPIFVGDGKLMLIEYKYGYVACETFMARQDIPSQFFYKLKKDFFPWAYWNLVPRGIWHGRRTILPAFTKAFTSI